MAMSNSLPAGVTALLDLAADAIRRAHALAVHVESGRAIDDYLRLTHDLEVYARDLRAT